ncbi:hypothetical protein [Vibrio agarivorans]|uniref:hypothetical protein n=1 Tax=Vibrio agarivorans TaxID=153622 RepID=UPI0025B386FC|nr:hypothetical protein [Vibrio agarivorans]MDN3661093.1 hypothetical protein [Vibrio agarivorans]
MRLKPLTLLVFTLSSSPAFAVVCTDPTGNALHLQEMAKTAAIWLEEKSMYLATMTQDKAISLYEMMRQEYMQSANISATTSAISTTQNAASEERYSASPSACESFKRVKGYLNSMTSTCENPLTEALFENNQSQITDCGTGGSGLNCDRVQNRRNEIASEINNAVKDKDGSKLLNVLDGSKLLGLSDAPMTPENADEHDLALSLLLGVEEPDDLPRLANGDMLDPNSVSGSLEVSTWARGHVLRSIPNGALSRIKRMNQPQPDGSASQMAMLEEQVNYYNSEQFIKLLSNTNDKDGLPTNWEQLTPAQKHDWNRMADTDSKMTSSEQVIRMLGEMEALSLRLNFLQLEAVNSTNALAALQLKVMSQ